jgi:hypothetical protein
MKEKPIYKTQDLDVSAFLIFEGIKFIECKAEGSVVYFYFEDTKSNCLDLERVFLNSEFKRYRTIHRYLLKQVHQALRQIKKED